MNIRTLNLVRPQQHNSICRVKKNDLRPGFLYHLVLFLVLFLSVVGCGGDSGGKGRHYGLANASFSNDNKYIVFDYCQGIDGSSTCDIATYEIATGKVQRFNPTGNIFSSAVSYSPDGERITFQSRNYDDLSESNIYVAKADGSNAKQITGNASGKHDNKGAIIRFDSRPSFSNDGKRVIFKRAARVRERAYPLRGTMLSSFDVYEVELSTGIECKLTDYSFYEMSKPYYLPDGGKFIFSAYGPTRKAGQFPANPEEYSQKYRNNNIFIMDGRKNEIRPAFVNGKSSERPSVSRDGDILFSSVTNEMDNLPGPKNNDLFLCRKGNITRVTKMGAYIQESSISTDGTRAVFYADTNKTRKGRYTLWIVNTDGTGLSKIPLPWDELQKCKVQSFNDKARTR